MSERMQVATRKGLFTLTRNNNDWNIASTAFLGSPVSNVLHDARDGAIYAALNFGHFGAKLHRSDDGGIDWSELPAPASPPGNVAISCGGVWETRDGGKSWKLHGEGMVATYKPPDQAGALESQDPNRVARCAAAPDTMWMQHHCGIFCSSDAGATWTQLKPPGGDFGFAVAAHPKDCATAWFVPAVNDKFRYPRDGAMSLTRTRDGGKNWKTFRDGLPQRDAYDLIYRHGLDVDVASTRLAMGSIMGALWVSDDAGERWQLINAHLPPIYAVHFH